MKKLDKKFRSDKYKDIQIKPFYDVDDVNNLIRKEVNELKEHNDLVIYAKGNLISELFISLIEGGYDFDYIDLDRIDDLLKSKVYIMTINNECRMNIELAYHKGKIVGHKSKTALFYTDDCKQDIIDYSIDNSIKVIMFDFEQQIATIPSALDSG